MFNRSLCAGDLSHKLRIEQKTETQSSSGAVGVTWALLATVWGDLQPLTGKEFIAAEQMTSKIEAKAYIRYRTDVTANMRIVFKSVNYNIEAVLPDPRFAERLMLMLSSGANAG